MSSTVTAPAAVSADGLRAGDEGTGFALTLDAAVGADAGLTGVRGAEETLAVVEQTALVSAVGRRSCDTGEKSWLRQKLIF